MFDNRYMCNTKLLFVQSISSLEMLFNGWKPYFLVHSLDFIFHCIAASALILHLPRTFSYNRFLDDPTKYVIYYYWLLISGGSCDSDFVLSRSHRPRIALIIILLITKMSCYMHNNYYHVRVCVCVHVTSSNVESHNYATRRPITIWRVT